MHTRQRSTALVRARQKLLPELLSTKFVVRPFDLICLIDKGRAIRITSYTDALQALGSGDVQVMEVIGYVT